MESLIHELFYNNQKLSQLQLPRSPPYEVRLSYELFSDELDEMSIDVFSVLSDILILQTLLPYYPTLTLSPSLERYRLSQHVYVVDFPEFDEDVEMSIFFHRGNTKDFVAVSVQVRDICGELLATVESDFLIHDKFVPKIELC